MLAEIFMSILCSGQLQNYWSVLQRHAIAKLHQACLKTNKERKKDLLQHYMTLWVCWNNADNMILQKVLKTHARKVATVIKIVSMTNTEHFYFHIQLANSFRINSLHYVKFKQQWNRRSWWWTGDKAVIIQSKTSWTNRHLLPSHFPHW